jgi:hypothetical protein
MRILRWVSVRLLAFGLSLLLAVLSICAIIYATVGNPGFIESVFDTSGLYNNFVDSGLKLASDGLDGEDTQVSQIVSDLTPSVKEVITPEFLQTSTEEIIDGVGNWLNGKTTIPEFSIDTGSVKADLNAELATYLSQYVTTLPDCQTYAAINSLDIFTTDCKPHIPIDQDTYLSAANQFTSEIPIFDKNSLSSSELIKNTGDNVWKTVPNAYKFIKLAPYIAGGLVLICSALILIISGNRARSIRKIGHIFLSNALILLIVGTVIIVFLGHGEINFVGGDSVEQIAFAKEIIEPLVHGVARVLGSWLLYFGGGYALIAVTCYFVAHFMNRQKSDSTDSEPKPEETSQDQAPATEQPAEQSTKQPLEESSYTEEVLVSNEPPVYKTSFDSPSDKPNVPGPPAPKPPLVQ